MYTPFDYVIYLLGTLPIEIFAYVCNDEYAGIHIAIYYMLAKGCK